MRTRASQACRQRARARHCRRWLAISLFASWLQAASAADPDKATPPASVIFDERFLKQPDGLAIDVSRFARGNPVSAGQYTVDQYLNGGWLGRNTVQFQDVGGKIVPCIGPALISQFNLDESVVSPEGRATLARASTGECVDPGAISSDVTWTFDLSELRLDISVPQALLRHTPRGYVGPEFWDAGIPSATLGYNFNTFHSAGTLSSTTTFLGIDAGVNLGTWHLRQRSSMTWQTAGRNPYDYQNLATYLQHDIPSWRGQLTLGDAFTDGAVFDSFGVRGVQIASDDRMLPDSMRGYAPLIRGIAQTNARVTVTQNGNKLYETTVAPGPFEINDLYATGYGGNLQVTVTEADGSQHSFAVPYASVAQLIRPGITRFSVAAGQYRDTTISSKERLVQATVQHGFTNLLTGYAGVVLAEGYQAGLIGAGFNTPVGALAVDVTQAKANIPGVDNTSGQSLRVSYSKFVPATNTNVAVAAYRYSSSGFWQMRDTFLARDRVSHGGEVTGVQRQRSQMQLTLNQTLGGRLGSVYVTGTSLSYWNRNGTATQYQLGYSNFVRLFGALVTLNLSASRQREVLSGTMSTQIFAGITVPLGSGVHAPLLSLGYTNNSVTGSSEQLLLNGTALEDNSFSYGLSANHASSTTTGGGNVQYRSPYATVSASASGGSGYSQYSAGVQGALVV
ncbi:MAG: fimbrial biogenesis outer membrane usher protein, partial [Cupriavidus sp.]|nr:fimbrial biogenesis outer membrane usher protein [Cupriavidus sp.]